MNDRYVQNTTDTYISGDQVTRDDNGNTKSRERQLEYKTNHRTGIQRKLLNKINDYNTQ